jgi:anti-sigma regulatory factor (Ser/Thr protein kinase)
MLLDRLSAAGGSGLADPDGRVLELALPATPVSVGVARRALLAYCRERHVPHDVEETGELIISELVTNAVQHAGTPFLVWVEHDADELTVAVLDGNTSSPHLRAFDTERYGGRGMPLVEALGAAWGTATTRLGKVVWVTIAAEAAHLPEPRREPTNTLD